MVNKIRKSFIYIVLIFNYFSVTGRIFYNMFEVIAYVIQYFLGTIVLYNLKILIR